METAAAFEDNGKPSGRGGTQCPRYAVQGGKSLNPHMQPGTNCRAGRERSLSNTQICINVFSPIPHRDFIV